MFAGFTIMTVISWARISVYFGICNCLCILFDIGIMLSFPLEPSLDVFTVLNYSLAVIGGLVGALSCLLLPKTTTGITLGFMLYLIGRLVQ